MKLDKPQSSPKSFTLFTHPIIPPHYYTIITFELITTLYYLFLVSLNLSPSMINIHVVVYAILYFINNCLSNIITTQQSIDELGLFPTKIMLSRMRILVKLNMLYLLIRLMLSTYSLSATVLLALYIVNDLYRPQKKIKS